MLKKQRKSKEQLLQEQKNSQEVLRKRKKVKEELYPLLLDNAKNVEDAKMLCQAIVVGIRQAFNNKLTEYKVADLGLIEMIDKDNPEYERNKMLVEMFNEEKVSDAISLLEGMNQAIDSFIREENTKRPLSELQTDFL